LNYADDSTTIQKKPQPLLVVSFLSESRDRDHDGFYEVLISSGQFREKVLAAQYAYQHHIDWY